MLCVRLRTVLQDGLDSLVAPDEIRPLDVAEGEVESVDDRVDRVACVRRGGLQPYDPRVELPRERPEHMHVEVGLGSSGGGGESRREVEQCAAKKREKRDRTCVVDRTSCQRVNHGSTTRLTRRPFYQSIAWRGRLRD